MRYDSVVIATLKTLLQGAIDYAGLFPPAALPMDEACAEYRSLVLGEHSWLVNRFVCPVAWLSDLLNYLPPSGSDPWPISVLGTSLEGYRQDLNAIERFEEAAGDRAVVEGYEVKVLPDQVHFGALKSLANVGFDEVFLEVPFGSTQLERIHDIATVEGLGVKARTGGLQASAFPSSSDLASFIYESIALDLPLKMTAGLHHPLPIHDEATEGDMHGFLNVLCATVLAKELDLTRPEIEQILNFASPKDFMFTPENLTVGGWTCDLSAITSGRETFLNWGSCSVTEPLEDLARLGLS